MVFSTHSLKSALLEQARRCLITASFFCICLISNAHASAELANFDLERGSEELNLSVQLQFELSATVEEALLKGIPMVFVAEAEVMRERWYWYDKTIATTTRQYRIAFQPLTRRWRLTTSSGPSNSNGQGLALNQGFDTLQQALAAVKRISRWRIAAANELESALRYRVEFKFRLDLSQLPRPFQIGAIGQSDWDISIVRNEVLAPETNK